MTIMKKNNLNIFELWCQTSLANNKKTKNKRNSFHILKEKSFQSIGMVDNFIYVNIFVLQRCVYIVTNLVKLIFKLPSLVHFSKNFSHKTGKNKYRRLIWICCIYYKKEEGKKKIVCERCSGVAYVACFVTVNFSFKFLAAKQTKIVRFI